MTRNKRYTAADMITALKTTKGMVYLAADKLECSHTTVYNYIKRYPTVKAEHEYQRGEMKDVAELKLREAVHKGEKWAIQFALQMLGADRGYAPKKQVEHSGTIDIIQMTWEEETNDDA